jgi:hypothetical protein
VRNDHEVQVAIPKLRQVVAVSVLALGAGVALGWVPFGPQMMGLALVLVAAGLLA